MKQTGRPTKMIPDTLQKLEDAFSNALPDIEACLYGGISPATLYNYQQKNPEFLERKQALRLTPNIAARKTIIASLGDVKVAQWWLEKKDPDFRPSSKIDHTAKIQTEDISRDPDVAEAIRQYEELRAKQIREQIRKKAPQGP